MSAFRVALHSFDGERYQDPKNSVQASNESFLKERCLVMVMVLST